MPPITHVIPTQQQLYDFQHDPNSLLAMYNAANVANAPKPAVAGNTPTTLPGVAPGSTTTSPSILAPVNPLPTTVPTPQIDYTPQNNTEWITAMTDMVNQINMKAQQNANAGRIPGGAGLEALSSGNIGSALGGQLPGDVQRQIEEAAATRGVTSGSPWGANTNADYLRAIGLNSLQLQNQGQDWLTAALARNPSAPLFDPSKLLITPAQASGFGMDQANFGLRQQELINTVQNANAQRQLQADLANASTALERERILANFQNDELNRQNALRIAAMRNASGYGHGGGSGGYPRSGGGGGGFAPATNWQGGGQTPITEPWHLPYSLDQSGGSGSMAGAGWTPGTYTDDMNPLYGYTPQGGLPNTLPGSAPWQPPSLDSWDNLLSGGNAGYNDLTEEEWEDLYGAGG